MTLIIAEAVSIAVVAMPLQHRAPAILGRARSAQNQLAQNLIFPCLQKEDALSDFGVHRPNRLNPI